MAGADWRRVIDQAAALGVRLVQFIGGEPTLHPELPGLVDHALRLRVGVEVFSNLVRVTPQLWDKFARPGVRLATSYYTDDASQHETITRGRGSHTVTTANIAEAVSRSIPLRVGLIDVMDGQRVTQARDQLTALGVTDIGTDHLRQVGRGVRDHGADVSQLCGACARGKVAVSPTGEVWPCVFARWMPLGNVRVTPLAQIVTAERMRSVWSELGYREMSRCSSDSRCDPSKSDCQPHCPPGYHSDPKKCWPYYYEERKR
jgi:MoaA/NifB/PqqE/SkfB family radical SAM enzyme